MKIKTVNIIIERDPMTKIPKNVRAWEVEIYRAKYGVEHVEILGNGPDADIDDDLDVQAEYFQMRQRFGIDSDTKQSHVELVYGRPPDGIEKLEKAINAGKGGDVKAVEKVIDGKSKVGDDVAEARENAHRDPLEGEFADQTNSSMVGAAAGGPGDVSDASGKAGSKK